MTINALSQQNATLSFLKTAINIAQRQNQATQPDTPSTVLDSSQAQSFRDEQARLKQTLQQLQAAKTESNEQKQEAARQKIERLKAQIQALRMMAGGDPKTLARQAARLSRELASAAREYASASGGANVAAPAATAPVATETATADGTTTAPAAIAPTSTPSTISGTSEEDANFSREARRMMNELKRMVRDAKEKMKTDNNDTHDAEKSLADTANALNAIAIGNIAMPPGASVSLLT